MSSSDESPSDSQQHTPYCDDGCTIEHHPLLQMILALPGILGDKKIELNQCIRKYKAGGGWNVDDPIPDSIPEFRYPMLHWAAALSKLHLAS